MQNLPTLLLLTAAGLAPPAAPLPLPGRAEAAVAFFEYQANICRALIDQCEPGLVVGAPDQVTGLFCRAGQRGHAACRFEMANHRCLADFVSAAAGSDHAWARRWSRLPEPSGQVWTVTWTHPPRPREPRIRCQPIG